MRRRMASTPQRVIRVIFNDLHEQPSRTHVGWPTPPTRVPPFTRQQPPPVMVAPSKRNGLGILRVPSSLNNSALVASRLPRALDKRSVEEYTVPLTGPGVIGSKIPMV